MSYSPQFHISPQIAGLLEEITTLNTRIQSAVVGVPWIPTLRKESEIRGTRGSTAIEGNPLTLPEVRILAEGGRLPYARPRAIQEVLNYFAVLRMIAQHSNAKVIHEEDVLRIHRLLGQEGALDRGPFGAYRDYQVVVGRHRPPGAEAVPALMHELLDWVNHEGQKWPAVVSSAILHFRFEDIHPFGDGNGRAGRALALWELYRKKLDTHHLFAVDEVIWERRPAYYLALDYAQRPGVGQDLTPWIQFIAEVIAESLRRAWERVQKISRDVKSTESIVLTPNQEKLFELLQEKPMGIQEIINSLKVTKPGAHYLLKPLLKIKWIVRKGGHKTGKYYISSH